MRKRILATILAIAILLGAFPATITFASTSSAILTVKANKSTVNPGDEVDFSVELSQTGDIAAIEAYIELPDGLTLVNGSFVAETDKSTLGWDDFTVNENYLMIYGYGSIGYKETLITLASFKCIVDADAENQLIVDVFDVSALDANMEDKYPTSVAAVLNVVTIGKSTVSNRCHAIWDTNGGKFRTMIKGIVSNRCNAIRNRNRDKLRTTFKSGVSYGCNTIFNNHLRNVCSPWSG